MKSHIEIRKVVKADLLHIFKLEEEAFAPMNYPLFVLRQFFDLFPDLILVAVDELNHIKGYCFGGIDQESKIGWILALAVTKPNQRMKIGQLVTSALLTAFKNKKISTVHLTTTPDNTAAINLYEKLGFKKLKKIMDYYFDGTPRIIMTYKID